MKRVSRRLPSIVLAIAVASLSAHPARAADPTVGTWVGTGSHEGRDDQFNMRLTFVSPKGGVSRYPGDPRCGGMLVGDRKGDAYEYKETITFNGSDERTVNYCVSGVVRLTVEGRTMKYDSQPYSAGDELAASGTLERVGSR